MLTGRVAASILSFLLTGFLWTRCSEEQLFPGNARIKTAFRLTSPTALDGSITIQEAYLKLKGITVTGRLGDKNAPEASYPIPPEDPPFRLSQADTARVSLTLPTRVYDQMDLHLFLLQTDYQLIVHQKTSEETPPPVNDGNDEPTGGVTAPNDGNDEDAPDNGDQDNAEHDESHDGRDEEGDDEDERDDDDGDNKKDDDDDKDDGKKGKKNDKDKDDDKKKNDDGDDDRRSANEANGTVDLDHFFQHAKPSLVVIATWIVNGTDINVVFAVTDAERIMIRAIQNGSLQIKVGEHGRGVVNFDPQRWFESISTTDLQNASLQTYQGQPVMFIHKDVNSTLFETLLRNLTSSTTFDVAASSDQ